MAYFINTAALNIDHLVCVVLASVQITIAPSFYGHSDIQQRPDAGQA